MATKQYTNVGEEFELGQMTFESIDDVSAAHESRMWKLHKKLGEGTITHVSYMQESEKIFKALQSYIRSQITAVAQEVPFYIKVIHND